MIVSKDYSFKESWFFKFIFSLICVFNNLIVVKWRVKWIRHDWDISSWTCFIAKEWFCCRHLDLRRRNIIFYHLRSHWLLINRSLNYFSCINCSRSWQSWLNLSLLLRHFYWWRSWFLCFWIRNINDVSFLKLSFVCFFNIIFNYAEENRNNCLLGTVFLLMNDLHLHVSIHSIKHMFSRSMELNSCCLIMMEHSCNICEMQSTCFIRYLQHMHFLKKIDINIFEVLISKLNSYRWNIVWNIIEIYLDGWLVMTLLIRGNLQNDTHQANLDLLWSNQSLQVWLLKLTKRLTF